MRWIGCVWFWVTAHATVLSTVASAIAAGVIAWFTVRLSGATSGQLRQLRNQLDLAQREFISTHRPRLRIRHVVLATPTEGFPLSVAYEIHNIGESEIKAVDGQATLGVATRIQKREGEKAFLETTHEFSITKPIEVGSFVLDAFAMDNPYDGKLGIGASGSLNDVVFRGFFGYTDANGVKRRTAFHRTWTAETNRFVRSDDPDYEYED